MNRYLTGHLPLISIFLFSLSFALYGQRLAIDWLEQNGILDGMADLLSINEIRIGLILMLMLLFFMIFSALKLIADTVNSLSFLFFSSKADESNSGSKTEGGQWIYFIGSIVALVLHPFIIVVLLAFLVASFAYIVFVVYRIAESLTIPGLIGFICFHLFFWAAFLFTILFVVFRLYNTFIASLPL
ncbi:DUF5366 family protein [Shouchella sp. JSM 1781072]|uniref:DUF5366 family protein n=1 Tax=Bacillaceae TaxID=186817 RepID=UPI0020D00395|nr:DUF5366 family protein [Alkalihalobacillus sp. LMS6]UTR07764.1 YufK family protein [Alkalihalobacillus sp. LMS6]